MNRAASVSNGGGLLRVLRVLDIASLAVSLGPPIPILVEADIVGVFIRITYPLSAERRHLEQDLHISIPLWTASPVPDERSNTNIYCRLHQLTSSNGTPKHNVFAQETTVFLAPRR